MGFTKGNKLGSLNKGKTKMDVVKEVIIPVPILQHSLNYFTPERISELIEALPNAEKKLQFFVKITEMLLKSKVDDITLKLAMERLRQIEEQINPSKIDNITIGYSIED